MEDNYSDDFNKLQSSNHGKLAGFVGRDSFGRVFIDRCMNTEEHLTKAVVPEGAERPGCRTYLDDILIPEEFFGQNVKVYFEMRFTLCTENK